MSSPGPLAGLKVIDVCQLAVGPLAAAWLGQLGAEVIKVEAPSGDPIRRLEPWIGGVGTYYAAVNVNKRNIKLDLKNHDDLALLLELCGDADVFIQNFRPGVIERLGLGYGRLRELNPALVYISASGYGSHGVRSGEGGADPFIRMFTSFDEVNGGEGRPAERFRNRGHIDHITSAYLVQAALAGLYARSRTGLGQHIESSMMQAAIAYQATVIAQYLASGEQPRPLGSKGRWGFPDQAFAASDGHLALSALLPSQWRGLAAALELPEELRLPDSTSDEREAVRDRLEPAIAARLSARTVDEWVRILAGAGVPAGPYVRLEDLCTSAAARTGHLVERVEHPWGTVQLATPPWRFARTPVSLRRAPAEDEDGPRLRAEVGAEDASPRRSGPPANAADPRGAPLTGVRVIELCPVGIGAGYAGMQLADLGADVVRIEPVAGDPLRQLGARSVENPAYSALYGELNRGKRVASVDFSDAADVAALRALVGSADAVLTDLAAAELRPHGLDPEALVAGAPALVFCQLTGYGSEGELAGRPASEITVQALVGTWRYVGAPGQPPLRAGTDVATIAGGVMGVQAVIAALLAAAGSGAGQVVEVGELAAMVGLAGHLVSAYTDPGLTGGWHLSAPDMAIEYPLQAADGPIDYSFPDDFSFREFYRAIGVPEDVVNNPVFTDKFDIVVHWDQYIATIGPYVKQLAAADLIELVEAFGGIAVHGNTYASLLRDQQLADMNVVARAGGTGDPVGLNPPWNFGSSVLPARRPAPAEAQRLAVTHWLAEAEARA